MKECNSDRDVDKLKRRKLEFDQIPLGTPFRVTWLFNNTPWSKTGLAVEIHGKRIFYWYDESRDDWVRDHPSHLCAGPKEITFILEGDD